MDRFDAFTQKPTSQYSLAYEKASIIFNISRRTLMPCCISETGPRIPGSRLLIILSKHLPACSTTSTRISCTPRPWDLSRDTVKTLIAIMLAQGQEVFLEKQIADGKKVGLLAKLASQAASLYAGAVEGISENVSKGIFERVWLLVVQMKASHMASLAQYYQASC